MAVNYQTFYIALLCLFITLVLVGILKRVFEVRSYAKAESKLKADTAMKEAGALAAVSTVKTQGVRPVSRPLASVRPITSFPSPVADEKPLAGSVNNTWRWPGPAPRPPVSTVTRMETVRESAPVRDDYNPAVAAYLLEYAVSEPAPVAVADTVEVQRYEAPSAYSPEPSPAPAPDTSWSCGSSSSDTSTSYSEASSSDSSSSYDSGSCSSSSSDW